MKCSCWICALLGLLWLSIIVRANEPAPSSAIQPGDASSADLDAELFEGLSDDLDDELLEGLELPPAREGRPANGESTDDANPRGDAARRPGTVPNDAPAGQQDDRRRGFGAGDTSTGGDNPLVRLGNQMRDVQRLIGRGQSGGETQRLQHEIVAELDQLIEQLRNSPPSSNNSSGQQRQQQQQQSERQQVQPPQATPGQATGNTPGTPGERPADSTGRVEQGTAEATDMQQMNHLLKDIWGHLPERQRQQMLQSAVEQFLPKYETMIEAYFRRLAEETNQP